MLWINNWVVMVRLPSKSSSGLPGPVACAGSTAVVAPAVGAVSTIVPVDTYCVGTFRKTAPPMTSAKKNTGTATYHRRRRTPIVFQKSTVPPIGGLAPARSPPRFHSTLRVFDVQWARRTRHLSDPSDQGPRRYVTG